jgi:hypothetical protein
LSAFASVGLAGCSGGGLGNNTPSEFRLEAEAVTGSQICEGAIERLEVLGPPEEAAVKRLIAGEDETVVDFTGRKQLYLEGEDGYHHVEIRHRDDADDYRLSLVESVGTRGAMCELVQDELVVAVAESGANEEVRETIRKTVENGPFESAPLNESATESLNFFVDIKYGRGTHPLYLQVQGELYKFEMYYTSGE